MIKDLIIQEIEAQITSGKITSKESILDSVIKIEKKLLEDQSLMTILDKRGIPLKEGDYKDYVESLLETFDKQHQKPENITTFKTGQGEIVELKEDNEYKVANNHDNTDPLDQLNKIQNDSLKQNEKISDEEIFDKYQQQNKTYEFYDIESRKGYEMNQEELRNLNIFIKTVLDEGLEIENYRTTFDCSTYINQLTGEIYFVEDNKLVKAKQEELNEEIKEEQVVTKEEQELLDMSNEELQTKLEKYTDEELIELYQTLNDEELKGTIKKMISNDFEFNQDTNTFDRTIQPKVYVFEKKDVNKAAFVNILILSIVSFTVSILMILLILIKYNL